LRQADEGTPVAEVCRKAGISDATFYSWKKRYGGFTPSEVKRMRQLEDENNRLKKIVADLTLDKAMLQDVLSKTYGPPRLQEGFEGGLRGLIKRGVRGLLKRIRSREALLAAKMDIRASRSS